MNRLGAAVSATFLAWGCGGTSLPYAEIDGMCYCSTLIPMKAGIRRVRQNLSALLREVRKGKEIEITDRGEPVALLSPPLAKVARRFGGGQACVHPCRSSIRRSAGRFSVTAKTGSRRAAGLRGPLYVDASALAKLYLPEAESNTLEALLLGRSDLVVSDLAVTEVVSAAARRRREGHLGEVHLVRLHQALLDDLASGSFLAAHLDSSTHRAAERLLIQMPGALRAADALSSGDGLRCGCQDPDRLRPALDRGRRVRRSPRRPARLALVLRSGARRWSRQGTEELDATCPQWPWLIRADAQDGRPIEDMALQLPAHFGAEPGLSSWDA